MQIHESSEDYLEAILIIREKQGYVRSVDISQQLKVSKPSVSYATKRLKNAKLLSTDKNGMILFTKEGEKIAKNIYNRHKTLIEFFMSLGVKEEIAKKDACKVEHDISEETFDAIKHRLKQK